MVNSEIQNYFILWQDELVEGKNYSPTWPQYRSHAAIAFLKDRVAKSGSLPSISAFIIQFNSAVAQGLLKPVRVARPIEPESHDLTAAEYNATPAASIIAKYRGDPEYRRQVDALIQKGAI